MCIYYFCCLSTLPADSIGGINFKQLNYLSGHILPFIVARLFYALTQDWLLAGSNSIYFYTPQLFSQGGSDQTEALAYTCIIGAGGLHQNCFGKCFAPALRALITMLPCVKLRPPKSESVFCNAVNVGATFVSVIGVDWFGRKPLLIEGGIQV